MAKKKPVKKATRRKAPKKESKEVSTLLWIGIAMVILGLLLNVLDTVLVIAGAVLIIIAILKKTKV